MQNKVLDYPIVEYQVNDLSSLSYDKGYNLRSAKLYMRFDSVGELVLLSEKPLTNVIVRAYYKGLAKKNGWHKEQLESMLSYFQV